MSRVFELIDKLSQEENLDRDEIIFLLNNRDENSAAYIGKLARERATRVYGNNVFLRGLIEFTNNCKNDCLYCGIRRSNSAAVRYRLTKEEILSCCEEGYGYGLRTFVLQGGEDGFYSDDDIADIVYDMRTKYPDVAITLSIGERSYEAYKKYYDAGADRFLLRHETASNDHYGMLHPKDLSLQNRKRCLSNLKELGYQVGAGFMVGSPYQTNEHLAEDFKYLKELDPEMIGIGPFIHSVDTPFAREPDGSFDETLYCLSILRLMFPKSLLPATTALGTIDNKGREKGILAGANVVMPSLSPGGARKNYLLYEGKTGIDDSARDNYESLIDKIEAIGYNAVSGRGDYKGWIRK